MIGSVVAKRRLVMAVMSALCLTACGRGAGTPAVQPSATPTPSPTTPTPSAPAESRLAVSGDRNGNVINIRATCGHEQRVATLGNDYVATYLSADGSLNGDAFHADIYDPAGPGSWEGRFHVYVRVTPPNGDYYTWFTRSTDGIADFSSAGGVTLSASVPPRTSVDIQAGGLSSNGPITVTGLIVC
jgi:hypothetical protein